MQNIANVPCGVNTQSKARPSRRIIGYSVSGLLLFGDAAGSVWNWFTAVALVFSGTGLLLKSFLGMVSSILDKSLNDILNVLLYEPQKYVACFLFVSHKIKSK
jgi:hypothetical protein